MFIRKLYLFQFKNYTEAELSFGEGVNCFAGNNGAGKTNILDAVHYLALCKSYFNPVDSQNIRFDEPFFMIRGWFDNDGVEEVIDCNLKRGQKKQFSRNKDEYMRLADHIGFIPLVMIAPTDTQLILGGSDERRKLLDSVISQYDKEYLDQVILYNKALTQRNVLLKQLSGRGRFDNTSLEVWNDQLALYGTPVFEKRKLFVNQLSPLFTEFFEFISGGGEKVEIEYQSQLSTMTFEHLFQQNIDKDLQMGHTTCGVHKDDLLFKIHGYPIKKYGSQGQQKSFIISLKLAEYEYFRRDKGLAPLLLLDDIFDKLDESRVMRLMQLVSREGFGQLFLTDSNPERVKTIFSEIEIPIRLFNVSENSVTVGE